MTDSLSRSETWSLLSLSGACFGIITNTFQGDGAPLVASLAFSGLAYSATYALIRWLGPTFIKAGLKGRDMSKPSKKEMYCPPSPRPSDPSPADPFHSPETMGAVAASIYLLILIAFIPFPFYKDIVAATSGGGNRDVVLQVAEVETGRFLHRFPHSKVRIAPVGSCMHTHYLSSFPHIYPPSSPCIPQPYWASPTTYSTCDGVTKS